ncbi:MAG: C-GCAxxG-C-C family protein [Spirochaetes bacterium]|nr:C-GCAxxG-C-C family protein [Spirochaetota bacterium]
MSDKMSKAEKAVEIFDQGNNCAQAVLLAYAEDLALDKNLALSAAAGFGGGIGKSQGICGAASGAVMVLGFRSDFKEGDGRPKINSVYDKSAGFLEGFKKTAGSVNCLEILGGCNLFSEEGRKFFTENNLRDRCRSCIRLACDLLDAP